MIMMKIYMFVFLTFRLASAFTEEQSNGKDKLFDRIQALENKVADQYVVIADQRAVNLRQTRVLEEHEERLLKLSKDGCPCARRNTGRTSQKRFVVDNDGPVAFTAAIAPIVINDVKDKETIKFETMITSIGGGYNNLTGVFVAPISGIYAFSCSLLDNMGAHMAHNGAMLHAEIVHNQRVLGRIFAHATPSYRDQGAQTVFAQVNQGDQVWVRNFENPDVGLGGELYSTFSGYLLQAIS